MNGSESLDNLKRAIGTLDRFLASPVVDDRDRAGVIQAFEFCFEALWKALQKLGEAEGLRVASPRRAFSAALQLDLIDDEDEWLQVLSDRNLTVHAVLQQSQFDAIQGTGGAAANGAPLLRKRVNVDAGDLAACKEPPSDTLLET